MKAPGKTFSQNAVKIPGPRGKYWVKSPGEVHFPWPLFFSELPHKGICSEGKGPGWGMAVEKLLWANEMGMGEGVAVALGPRGCTKAGRHTRVGVCWRSAPQPLGVLWQCSTVWGQRATARRWVTEASLMNATERSAETWWGSAWVGKWNRKRTRRIGKFWKCSESQEKAQKERESKKSKPGGESVVRDNFVKTLKGD